MRWEHIKLAERQKASRIIADLRRDYTCRQVADMFGFKSRTYVSFAQHLYKRSTDSYICPAWAIEKILEHGELMGARRTIMR